MKIIKNGIAITPEGQRRLDIGIENDTIVSLEETITAEEGDEVMDASLRYVYPSFIPVTESEVKDQKTMSLKELYLSKGRDRDLLLYQLITGETKLVTVSGESETEKKLMPSIFMKLTFEALDPYGYMQILSENPAKVKGQYPNLGAIALGSKACLTIWDPNHKETIHKNETWDEGAVLYDGAVIIGCPKEIIS